MSDKTYNLLKNVSLFGTPFLAFLTSLCAIWGIPHTTEITATLTALDTLMGAVVIIAKQIYDKNESGDLDGNE